MPYFVQLNLRGKNYFESISIKGCKYVTDFKQAIKERFSPILDSYAAAQLTLFKPDGTTEIHPGDAIKELAKMEVGPKNPLVVTVDELPTPARTGSYKKQLAYKGPTIEATCRNYLDLIARNAFDIYEFEKVYRSATMGDLLAAKSGEEGVTWHYRKSHGRPLTNIPLPSIFPDRIWEMLKKMNDETTLRIHDAALPSTSNGRKRFMVIPHDKYTDPFIKDLKFAAATIGAVFSEDDLVVKDESTLSGSSISETGSP